MALGGGTFVTQNKVINGAYINVVSAKYTNSVLGERGVVAIALPFTTFDSNKVIELTPESYWQNKESYVADEVNEYTLFAIEEILKHASKIYLFNKFLAAGDVTTADILLAFEPYEFNILAAYTNDSSEITEYIERVKTWRDTYGKKCQLVTYGTTGSNYEGVINVVNKVTDTGAPNHALVAWVAGAQAGCAVNKSVTNMAYDGRYTIDTNYTQAQLEKFIADGDFAFHMSYGVPRVLDDINTLKTVTESKGEDFKYNQTIRVCDQICNDIAKLFNTKYLGTIPNDNDGRISLRGDIVKHHKELETLRAIENFDSSTVVVSQGNSKKSVVITEAITPVHAMGQLYLTIYVQ